jgi:lipid A biosynthesis (KDO)2-(lauroyl)-lipid IVA acyltransferase
MAEGATEDPRFEFGLLAPRYWGEWLGVVLLSLVAALPRPWVAALSRRLGALAYRRNHKRREVTLRNLAYCFPEQAPQEREAMARAHFEMTAQCLIDYGLLFWAGNRRLRSLVGLRGIEYYTQAREAGRPVIMLAPHALGLEFGGLALSGRYPGVSLFNRSRSRLADWLNFRSRTRFGATLYQRAHGLRPLLRALKRGDFLYYLPDEDFGAENAQFVPFFAATKATLPTLGGLARAAGAAVIPCFTYYVPETGAYETQLLPALRDFPTGDRAEDARRMNAAIEDCVRLRPEQYMWTLKLFRTRPPGAPSIYD